MFFVELRCNTIKFSSFLNYSEKVFDLFVFRSTQKKHVRHEHHHAKPHHHHIDGHSEWKFFYSWEGENTPKIFKVQIANTTELLSKEELQNLFVEDGVDLRYVENIRYLHEKEGGYVNIPSHGIFFFLHKVKDKGLYLQLQKSRGTKLLQPSVGFDFNLAFIFDTLNPTIKTKLVACGEITERVYRAAIKGVGPKFDLSLRSQLILVFGPPFKQLYYHEPIELGRGIDILWGFHLTWVSFKNTSGGILMMGFPLGLALGISYIWGGVLTPQTNHVDNSHVPRRPFQTTNV